MRQYQRLRERLQEPRVQRFDPAEPLRSPHVLEPTEENIKWALVEQASSQQLAAISLRFISIASTVLDRVTGVDLAGPGVPGWPVPVGLPPQPEWWPNIIEEFFHILNFLQDEAGHPFEDYRFPNPDDLELQRELEAYGPEDLYMQMAPSLSLTPSERLAMVYYAVLQLLVRRARHLVDSTTKDAGTVYEAALWLAYVPSVLYGSWSPADVTQFLLPPEEADLYEISDLSDVDPDPQAMRARFPELWERGLDKVWREINATVPWV